MRGKDSLGMSVYATKKNEARFSNSLGPKHILWLLVQRPCMLLTEISFKAEHPGTAFQLGTVAPADLA